MNYENNEIRNWILNNEIYFNLGLKLMKNKYHFNNFIMMVFKEVNSKYDLINNYDFDLNQLDSEVIRKDLLLY